MSDPPHTILLDATPRPTGDVTIVPTALPMQPTNPADRGTLSLACPNCKAILVTRTRLENPVKGVECYECHTWSSRLLEGKPDSFGELEPT